MFDQTVERRLRPLAAAFAESDLVRIRVADGDTEIELRRRAAVRSPSQASTGGDPGLQRPDLISSDVVGVVRFVRSGLEEGARLEGDEEIAYVEALGIRNPVRSRGPGRIAGIYVGDGQPVEYGQPLFAIERV
jgi:acetyl-CoA carboxylase biotin carboxyl carrier protein